MRRQVPVNPELGRALEEVARPTSPEQLAARGVDRVRSISTGDLSTLLECAVNRTVMDRTTGVSPSELDTQMERTRSELTRLLRARRELDETRQRMLDMRDDLEGELSALSTQGAARLERAVSRARGEQERELYAELDELLHRAGASRGPMPRRMKEAIGRSLGQLEQRTKAAVVAELAHERERLESRLSKLRAELLLTEQALARASADVERGLASAWRGRSGLDPEDPHHDTKLVMLTQLYGYNCLLQQRA